MFVCEIADGAGSRFAVGLIGQLTACYLIADRVVVVPTYCKDAMNGAQERFAGVGEG